jgi:hypothetical protein
VLKAWKNYLRNYNDGRGVVLIGHSQGTGMLNELLSSEIEKSKAQRKLLISAILLGGNVTVKKGSDRGGDFKNIRACRSRRQVGCVLAFSTFNATPPANSLFGRTKKPGLEVLCTNPAALGGGSAKLSPIYPSKPFAQSVIGAEANAALQGLPRPATTWATFPGSVSGHCSRAGGADVLRVTPLGSSFNLTALPDATWGLHLTDANIALGNLVELARHQISLYERG